MLHLCDGHHTRDQVLAELQRRHGRPFGREQLDQLLAQLDDKLLLDSEKFRSHSAKIFAEFGRAEVRPAFHAGATYPKAAAELTALLDRCFGRPHGPGKPAAATGKLPRALIVPHIDFLRGGPVYAHGYRALLESAERPERIVLLGTDHVGHEQPFTLTRKHFETPLGRVRTDVELVAELHQRAGGDNLFVDEHHHRAEHSLEHHAVWLRYLYGEAMDQIPVLPVLCGHLTHFIEQLEDPAHSPTVSGFLGALATLTAGQRTLFIASADLSHVGLRFGDPRPVDEAERAQIEKKDQAALRPVAKGDPAALYEEIKKERDRRRVCGLAPICALPHPANPGRGELAAYAQCSR